MGVRISKDDDIAAGTHHGGRVLYIHLGSHGLVEYQGLS